MRRQQRSESALMQIPSAMTRRTARQHTFRTNVVVLDQLRPERRLVGSVHCWSPSQVEDLVSRPHVVFWVAVALQAPLHEQTVLLIGERHLVHASVTGDATDAL